MTRGFGSMPPQVNLVPQQKYDVLAYIADEFMAEQKPYRASAKKRKKARLDSDVAGQRIADKNVQVGSVLAEGLISIMKKTVLVICGIEIQPCGR